MPLERQRLIFEIEERLTGLSRRIKTFSGNGLNDAAKFLEPFASRLLNLVYGWHLTDPAPDVANTKAIDLIDEINKVAVQVSVQESVAKIAHTKEMLRDGKLANFTTIVVFFLHNKKHRKHHGLRVINIERLISDLKNRSVPLLGQVTALLNEEIRDGLESNSAIRTTPVPTLTAEPVSQSPAFLFFHPATNDDRYSRREKELTWLDDCAKNPNIRIATVTGQGGLGKTSLVGHWIERHRGWQQRPFSGVFFYSFYLDRDPKVFFSAFLKFVCDVEKIRELPKEAQPHHLSAAACGKWSYLVVLDGLEELQHGDDDPHYGWISDADLTEFVARVGAKGNSLLVLTSRFPFPNITDEHPDSARALALPLLTKDEGAHLLSVCGLTDSRVRLEGYSDLLGGHPLALRVFAGACLEQPFTEPKQVIRDVSSAKGVETMPDPNEPGLSEGAKQTRRQRRQFYKLLSWFQKKLSQPKIRLLQLVALFRDPARTESLASLALGMPVMKADFADCDRTRIAGLLEQLSRQFLLQKETAPGENNIRWTAHPIIHEVFRKAALAAGDSVAREFAEIVAGRVGRKRLTTVAEVIPIVEATEVLAANGDFIAADRLFSSRLDDGGVFQWIPCPRQGLRCVSAFLEPAERRETIGRVLGQRRLGFFLNWLAVFSRSLGDIKGTRQLFEESLRKLSDEKAWASVSISLQNLSEIRALEGDLYKAECAANEAMFFAGARQLDRTWELVLDYEFPPNEAPPKNDKQEIDSRSYRLNALSLTGELRKASREFEIADELSRRRQHRQSQLHVFPGKFWVRHRQRLGEFDAARALAESNREICEQLGWKADCAGYDLVLGELDLVASDFTAAERRLAKALDVFRSAQQGRDLPDALLALARLRRELHLAQKGSRSGGARLPRSFSLSAGEESALSHCEESLRQAARSGFLLKKCDALNFRALLLRECGDPKEAFSDGCEAHNIALDCRYYWGLHESIRQLRDITKDLNRIPDFHEWEAAERDLTVRMESELATAVRINREHDTKMENLYGPKQ